MGTPKTKTPFFICRAKGTDLYVQRRVSSWAELGPRKTATKQPRAWWDENMTSQAKNYFKLVPARRPPTASSRAAGGQSAGTSRSPRKKAGSRKTR